MSRPSEQAPELYGLPAEEFIPRRNELVKRLRAGGRREEAREVSKLRKPTVAAGVVNRLVRARPRELEQLIRAGDALREAQEGLMAGQGDPGELRRAADAERQAVEKLLELARALPEGEPSPATLDLVSETLHAAALEEEAREQVTAGCLVRELRHVGLGALGGPPAPATERSPASKRDRERERERREAEAKARRRAEQAAKELEAARRRRDQAAERLHEAEDALAQAQAEADRAARDHDEAVRALRA